MNIRFDIHTHVGEIPSSKRSSSTALQVSPEQAAAYLKKYNITHTVILYSDYTYIEQLSKLVDTKLYGVKWLNDPEYDSLDQGKPLYYGVKIHSHRGTYLRGGVRTYGVDYTHGKVMDGLLTRLNANEIVYMHMQGSSSPVNWAYPRTMLKWACKYPHLKFIMGHAGIYGGMDTLRPTVRPIFDTSLQSTNEGKTFLNSMQGYLFAIRNMTDAAEFTLYTHNLFLDTSVHNYLKGDILKNYSKWCIGSDFPFGTESVYSFDNQCNLFLKHITIEQLQDRFKAALNFIETDVYELAKIHLETNGLLYGHPSEEIDHQTQHISDYEEEHLSDDSSDMSTESDRDSYLPEMSRKKMTALYDPTAPKRKPGRPRIKPLPDPNQPKRKPGRPPRSDEGEEIVENMEKRKPGRPRIKPLPDPNQPKRRPGRPPGTKAKKVQDSNQAVSFTNMLMKILQVRQNENKLTE